MADTPSSSRGDAADAVDRSGGRRPGRDETSGSLVLSDSEGFIGDTITLKGRNLPAAAAIDVIWHTSAGRWGVLEANHIVGAQYQPRTEHITTERTDDDGGFTTTWTIPRDYGDLHTIELRDADSRTLANSTFTIRPWFEIDRTESPLGDMFTVTGYGLGPEAITNNYQVTWDNGVVGFMTGVMNRGTATADIRAVGPPGEHVLRVWRNYRGVPFLQNRTQSPFGPVGGDRQSSWTVEVTEPESELEPVWMDAQLDELSLTEHYPEIDEETDAELEVTPTSGQPGTEVTIKGRGFPENATVDLVWYTHEGHVIQGIPITTESNRDVLPTVTTDADGAFDVYVTIPISQGSTRPITAEIDGRSVAVTGFMVQPAFLDISPTAGPVGTDIEVTLTGIGWANYENNYFFVYDNRILGYVCGNDQEDGVVRTEFEAVGEPGVHFIDIIPGLFAVEENEPYFETRPHLSYIDNHPVRPLPAFHLTFEVTE